MILMILIKIKDWSEILLPTMYGSVVFSSKAGM